MPRRSTVDSEAIAADARVRTGLCPQAWKGGGQPAGSALRNEPKDPVLKMLRERRASLDTHKERPDRMDERFDGLDGKLDALGCAMQAAVRRESVQRKLGAPERRVARLEGRPEEHV